MMPLSFAAGDLFVYVLMALAALAVFAFLLCALGVTYFVIKRRERLAGAAWAAAAARLGLRLAPFDDATLSDFDSLRKKSGVRVETNGPATMQRMFGTYLNRPVDVWIRQVRSSQSSLVDSSALVPTKKLFTCCRFPLAGSLGLDLSIRRRGFVGQLAHAALSARSGTPAFDEYFDVAGNDAARVQELLGARANDGSAVAERFVAAACYGWDVSASDAEVRVEFQGMVLDADQLAAGLNVAHDLAARLEAAAAHANCHV